MGGSVSAVPCNLFPILFFSVSPCLRGEVLTLGLNLDFAFEILALLTIVAILAISSYFFSPGTRPHNILPGAECMHRSGEPATKRWSSRIAVGHVLLAHSRAHSNNAAGFDRRHLSQRQTVPHRFDAQPATSCSRGHSPGCRILAAQSRRECAALRMQYRSHKIQRPEAIAGEMASKFQGSFRGEENTDKPRLAS